MSFAIYARISRDLTGGAAGVDRQVSECRKLAEAAGLTITAEYIDNDISAYSGKPRPEYARLLDDVKEGRVTGIIAWHYDRLVRRTADLETLLDVIESSGATVRTVQAGELDLSTPTGRMTARVVASVASYEVEHSTARMRASQADRAARGLWRHGPPYGYRQTEVRGILEAHPEEWPHARRLAEGILGGQSALSLSRYMAEQGQVTRKGKKWTAGSVTNFLQSPVISARSLHRGVDVGPGQWPALVTPDEWQTLQAILSDPARRSHQGTERRWVLSGVLRCGTCGGGMKAQRYARSRDGWIYICRNVGCERMTTCPAIRTAEYVVETVLARIEAAGIPAANPSAGSDDDVAVLMAELDGLQARQAGLGRLYAAGDIDDAGWAAAAGGLRERVESVSARLDAARSASPAVDLLLTGDTLREAWKGLDIDSRAAVIREVVTPVCEPARAKGVPWTPDRIRLDWRS